MNLSQNCPRVRRERFSRSSRREECSLAPLNERRATPKCAKIALGPGLRPESALASLQRLNIEPLCSAHCASPSRFQGTTHMRIILR